ncbi:MAG: hypothetical protein GF346_04380, partial [Candidatus Eisenbacteria bacterium]|nr:hypothetical protein [Candidatus Latescibacterota bacterium]MBD3301664.1 hypothetical protein [Candidatus Eisenbacteria bacterium]
MMPRPIRRMIRFALLILAALAAGPPGCSNDHDLGPLIDPRDPAGGGAVPPVPTNIELRTFNREIIVSWSLSDSGRVEEVRTYRIYRRVPPASVPTLVDSSSGSPKTIAGIPNGQANQISVSAVLLGGLEGERSIEVGGTPGLFSIALEEGRIVTRNRTVRLDLAAPEGTRAVTIGSDPTLSEGVTRDFQTVLSWTLEGGDGAKSVHARFVDALGNRSAVVSDEIRLDTRAEILSFGFDGERERSPGDRIVFTMETGESGGAAEVEIGRGGPRRALRDDGSDPDAVSGDGIYALAYVAEASRQFLGAEMIGHFVDEAGNAAPERAAERALTVHAPPPSLELDSPASSSPQEITLTWSRAPEEAAFARYRLYRGDEPGVDSSASRRLVHETTDVSDTRATDSGLSPSRIYYYVVELVDPLGFATASNEVSGSPTANEA